VPVIIHATTTPITIQRNTPDNIGIIARKITITIATIGKRQGKS
jgi:hypothetical protein